MDPAAPDALQPLLTKARGDPAIAGVVLFGSAARGEPYDDLDVALMLRPGFEGQATDIRLAYIEAVLDTATEVDVQVFQSLPVYVRARVLRDHRVLLANDEDAMYDAAFSTVKEWADFRPFYEAYLEETGLA